MPKDVYSRFFTPRDMDDLPESIPIDYIKGVPNFISARRLIEEMKRREIVTAAAENRPVREIRYCQYCGTRRPSPAALNGHLRACSGRAKVRTAAAEGLVFTIGTVRFTVALNSIKLLGFLSNMERQLNEWLTTGRVDQETARLVFFSIVRGGMNTAPDGAITFEETAATAEV